MLRVYRGELLKPGFIEINPESENIFVDSIKDYGIDFKLKRVMFKIV